MKLHIIITYLLKLLVLFEKTESLTSYLAIKCIKLSFRKSWKQPMLALYLGK